MRLTCWFVVIGYIVTLSACAIDPPTEASTAPSLELQNYSILPRAESITETVFGIEISDDYRWMEREEHREEMLDWIRASGRHTNNLLSALPIHARLLNRFDRVTGEQVAISNVQTVGTRTFFLKTDAGAETARLILREDGVETLLVDPVSYTNAAGSPSAINNYSVSPSGGIVAFHIADGGGEVGTHRFLSLKTKQVLDLEINPVWGEFDVIWQDDRFFYLVVMTSLVESDPIQGMQVFRFDLQTGEKVPMLGYQIDGPPTVAPQEFPMVFTRSNSQWLLGLGLGARVDVRIFVKRQTEDNNAWRVIAGYENSINGGDLIGDYLYLLSTDNAPNGKVLKLDLAAGDTLENAKVVVPESGTSVITEIIAAQGGIYVVSLEEGFDTLKFLAADQDTPQTIRLPLKGVVSNLRAAPNKSDITFRLSSPLVNGRYYEASGENVRSTGLESSTYQGSSAFEIVSQLASSADGTQVPMTIMRPRGLVQDGSAPAILLAYGGYGLSIRPTYRTSRFPWLEEGGVHATCHVRGGGVRGRQWYEAGKGANKPNGHADYIACAERLIELGYTANDRILALGASMAGVLITPAALKRPDLFHVAAPIVAISNPTRILFAQNGANQIAELSDPRTAEGFLANYEMDAYHWLDRTKSYPHFIIPVGLNDQRVEPWFAAKFAAKLRSVSPETLTLVRTDEKAGHGVGSTRSQRDRQFADIYAFALSQFGLD